MLNSNLPKDISLSGQVSSEDYEDWDEKIIQDFQENEFNGHVGSKLLLETGRLRIWEIRLAPGQRWKAHRHVLDYFWTATSAGKSIQRTADGTIRHVEYTLGTTRSYKFAAGEFLLHDIENSGDDELTFITVEHLDSINSPLPL